MRLKRKNMKNFEVEDGKLKKIIPRYEKQELRDKFSYSTDEFLEGIEFLKQRIPEIETALGGVDFFEDESDSNIIRVVKTKLEEKFEKIKDQNKITDDNELFADKKVYDEYVTGDVEFKTEDNNWHFGWNFQSIEGSMTEEQKKRYFAGDRSQDIVESFFPGWHFFYKKIN